MPAYLCHGFRWQRRSICVFVIVQNLDDASPEWIIPARSSQCILESFYSLFDFLPYCVPPPRSRSVSGYGSSTLRTSRDGGGDDSEDESYVFNSATYSNRGTRSRSQSNATGRKSRSQSRTRSRQASNPPPLLPPGPPPSRPPRQIPEGHTASVADTSDEIKAQDWSVIKLLEEYDPTNLNEVSRPYAYVADYAVRVDLSVSIFDEIAKYEERARADGDPPVTGPSSDEGGAPGTTTKRKSSKKQQQAGTGWLERLRDQLQSGEEIRWYVVVNDDEARDWPEEEPESGSVKLAEAKRPAPTRAQQEHHSQYMLQQQIFEEIDSRGNRRRLVVTDRAQKVNPSVPEKESPALKTKRSAEGSGLRPKAPSKGGFRRLFGRNKTDALSP